MLSEQLNIAYEKQLVKFSSLVKNYEILAEKIIESIITEFSLNSTEGKVSITDSPSLFFMIQFQGGKRLHFEYFLSTKRAAYSFYVKKVLESRNHGGFIEMVCEANDYVYKGND